MTWEQIFRFNSEAALQDFLSRAEFREVRVDWRTRTAFASDPCKPTEAKPVDLGTPNGWKQFSSKTEIDDFTAARSPSKANRRNVPDNQQHERKRHDDEENRADETEARCDDGAEVSGMWSADDARQRLRDVRAEVT